MENNFLIIGMSPGNGYFKQEVVDKILAWVLANYKNTGVFIPDVPAVSTYLALGYPENVARGKKAIPQGNNFKNRIKRSIEENNLDGSRIRVFDWEKENIENNSEYRKQYVFVKNLYLSNKDFERDINQATEKVLIDNPFRKKDIELKDIQTGTHYILSEFAFILFAPDYIPGYSSYSYGYHNRWPVYEDFIAGRYDGVPKDIQFILLPNFSE